MPYRAEDDHSGPELGEAWKLFRTNTCRPWQAELNRAGVTHPGQFGARQIRDRPPDLEVSVCRPQIDLPPVTRPSSARPRTAPTCRTPRQRGSFAAFKSGGVWCPFRCVTRLGEPGGPRTASPQSDQQRVFSWVAYVFPEAATAITKHLVA